MVDNWEVSGCVREDIVCSVFVLIGATPQGFLKIQAIEHVGKSVNDVFQWPLSRAGYEAHSGSNNSGKKRPSILLPFGIGGTPLSNS